MGYIFTQVYTREIIPTIKVVNISITSKSLLTPLCRPYSRPFP